MKDKIRSVPSLPANVDPALRPVLQTLIDNVSVRMGQTSNKNDVSPTWNDLIGEKVVLRDPGTGKFRLAPETDRANRGTLFSKSEGIPPAITVLETHIGVESVMLRWYGFRIGYVDFIEVWRGTTPNVEEATLIGTAAGLLYSDVTLESETDYYYFARAVNAYDGNIYEGPWNLDGARHVFLPETGSSILSRLNDLINVEDRLGLIDGAEGLADRVTEIRDSLINPVTGELITQSELNDPLEDINAIVDAIQYPGTNASDLAIAFEALRADATNGVAVHEQLLQTLSVDEDGNERETTVFEQILADAALGASAMQYLRATFTDDDGNPVDATVAHASIVDAIEGSALWETAASVGELTGKVGLYNRDGEVVFSVQADVIGLHNRDGQAVAAMKMFIDGDGEGRLVIDGGAVTIADLTVEDFSVNQKATLFNTIVEELTGFRVTASGVEATTIDTDAVDIVSTLMLRGQAVTFPIYHSGTVDSGFGWQDTFSGRGTSIIAPYYWTPLHVGNAQLGTIPAEFAAPGTPIVLMGKWSGAIRMVTRSTPANGTDTTWEAKFRFRIGQGDVVNEIEKIFYITTNINQDRTIVCPEEQLHISHVSQGDGSEPIFVTVGFVFQRSGGYDGGNGDYWSSISSDFIAISCQR